MQELKYCLSGDCKIKLANGKERRLDKINLGDIVLGVDIKNKKLAPCKVTKISQNKENNLSAFSKLTFSDGQFIKVIGKHKLYNIDKEKFEFLDDFSLNKSFLKQDGSAVRLIEYKKYNRLVYYYRLETEFNNYFANGYLFGTENVEDFKLKDRHFLN